MHNRDHQKNRLRRPCGELVGLLCTLLTCCTGSIDDDRPAADRRAEAGRDVVTEIVVESATDVGHDGQDASSPPPDVSMVDRPLDVSSDRLDASMDRANEGGAVPDDAAVHDASGREVTVGPDGLPDDASTPTAAACAAYAASYCAHLLACSPFNLRITYGTPEMCRRRISLDCPDEFAAPGTALTPSGLTSCAQALAAAGCAEGMAKPLVACTWLGSLPDATACAHDAQCQSGFCNRAANAWCGVCAAKVGLNGACNPELLSACEGDLQCTSRRTCVAPVSLGSPCELSSQCVPGLVCASSSRLCAPPISLGGPCQSTAECSAPDDLYCVAGAAGSTCQPVTYASYGQACNYASAVVCSTLGTCRAADGSVATSGTCAPPASDGQACDLGTGLRCMPPALCMNGNCQLPPASTSCR